MDVTRKKSNWAELLDIGIDCDSSIPLFQQIYLAIRDNIVAHRLSPGSQLPSSRKLAERIGVSRTSVLTAYQQLLAEGFILGHAGSGTYVADDIPLPLVVTGTKTAHAKTGPRHVSRIASRYDELVRQPAESENGPFTIGRSSVDQHTIEAWREISARCFRGLDPVHLGYSDPAGIFELRREVSEYLRATRAVRCDPEQVIIVSGAQHAIDLSLRVLIDPDDPVWVEDPGYIPTRWALTSAGARIVAVPVDGNGLVVREGLRLEPGSRAAFVTPSHQYPTGSVMSMQRRFELLAWARDIGAWIIEDDYDSEFRYVGRPLASLQGLDEDERVIYVGTLSKILFPGIRLGYAVVPQGLVSKFKMARYLGDVQPSSMLQAVVAEFMHQGFLTSHIRRMRQRYQRARDLLLVRLQDHIGDYALVERPECGIQLMVRLAEGISDVAVAELARTQGVVVRAVSPMHINTVAQSALILGFSGFDDHSLNKGVLKLAKIIAAVAYDR